MLLTLAVAACAAIGYATGRWAAAAATAAVWPLVFAGIALGLWGNGFGDGWAPMLVLGTAVLAGSTAIGVAVRQATRRRARVG